MRHGHSLANQQGVIISHPARGCREYGLSDLGRRQVVESLADDRELDADTLIISSDFRRALESAQIAHRTLACKMPLTTDERLRERNFGELEAASDTSYAEVWREDARDPDSELHGVESANRVMRRTSALVIDLESRYRDASLLLVSHGDALQLLQAAFCKQDASQHRSLRHLETAEIRPLMLA
jgi:probable phosphoglycerate mutase